MFLPAQPNLARSFVFYKIVSYGKYIVYATLAFYVALPVVMKSQLLCRDIFGITFTKDEDARRQQTQK